MDYSIMYILHKSGSIIIAQYSVKAFMDNDIVDYFSGGAMGGRSLADLQPAMSDREPLYRSCSAPLFALTMALQLWSANRPAVLLWLRRWNSLHHCWRMPANRVQFCFDGSLPPVCMNRNALFGLSDTGNSRNSLAH